MRRYQILLCEDDLLLSRMIKRLLDREGCEVTCVHTGAAMEKAFVETKYDLILQDLNLPDADGIELIRKLRLFSDIPVIILTARTDVPDRVVGLDAGADDYLLKPFAESEFLARVRSLLRRFGLKADDQTRPDSQEWCDCTIDLVALQLQRGDKSVHLTERELLILMQLINHQGTVVSREEIFRAVYGREWDSMDRSVDVHIAHLRSKFNEIGLGRKKIQAVRGVGYRLIAEASVHT